MKRSTKKGFTIVELVIVIAIIAILAAVLIPTFASLIQKANESKDTQLVRNLNTALKTDGKEHKTMQDALDAAEAFGYDVGKINASATDNEILWDSVNDAFCYYNKDKGVEYLPQTELKDGKTPADYLLWKVYTSEDKVTKDLNDNKVYSIYWNSDAAYTKELKAGFDAGNSKADMTLKYVGGTSAQEVVIRTNGGMLTVDADLDTIYHYGEAGSVNVIKCAMASYHVFAKITGTVTVKKGHIDIESSGSVGNIDITADNSSDFAISNNKGGKLSFIKATNPSVITSDNVKVTEETGVMKDADKDAVAYSESKGFLTTWESVLGNGKTTILKDLNDKVYHLQVMAGVTATFDLNGHEFKTDENGNSYVCGNLTFMDSSADESGLYYCEVDWVSNVQDKTTLKVIGSDSILTIESGTIEAKSASGFDSNKGQFGVGVQDGGNIVMNGGTIKAGWYAIAGNGQDKDTSSSITINGGKLISVCDYAVYLPHNGVTVINGGVIDGAAGAVAINRGSLTINDGTFLSDGTGNLETAGDGTSAIGVKSLILVYGGYGTTDVVINGGVFNVANEYAIVYVDNNASIKISAGVYNKNLDKKWVGTGYVCVANDDGTWTVKKESN